MSGNNLDSQMNERLLTKIADLERQMREMRTLQRNSANALDVRAIPAGQNFLGVDDTIAGGGLISYAFQILPDYPLLTTWNLAFSVYVDLPGSTYDAAYLLPVGLSLSAGQQNMVVTSWLDYARSNDVTGDRYFLINIRNNDTSGHHIYVIGKFYGPYAPQE